MNNSPDSSKNPGSYSLLRQLRTVGVAGLVLATLFTAATPTGLIADALSGKLPNGEETLALFQPAAQTTPWPTPTPRPRPLIGIVAGHWGNDSGAVCSDGLTEEQVNLTVATLVKEQLTSQNFDVDLLQEFDPRLAGFEALALVSIHADSCTYVNDQATGFKVAAALSTSENQKDKANRLTACLRSRYAQVTGMPFHAASITPDMTSYHAFDEIHHETTAAIIETGFLNLDRQLLTQFPNKVAEGITRGILCYIYNESIPNPAPETTP